ncbi:MAG: hypothetical protein WCD86_11780 [Ktedonobacteraceae bacterium]|nr:hypothetical protein [Ktedonobacteraceae bacterium]
MPENALIVFIGWLIALAIFFIFIVLLRYLQYRERIAMLSYGMHPSHTRRGAGLLRAGLITAMVGLTLTIGLYPVGFLLPPLYAAAPFHFGPWLLPGLIPLGVGIALIASYYLERETFLPEGEHELPDAKAKQKRDESRQDD